jgi:hypothetical protein
LGQVHEFMPQHGFEMLLWNIAKKDMVVTNERPSAQQAGRPARGVILVDPEFSGQLGFQVAKPLMCFPRQVGSAVLTSRLRYQLADLIFIYPMVMAELSSGGLA